MSKNTKLDNVHLWDEIFNTIVDVMPEQFFPLFKEVYGKEYPKGTPIIRLSTVSSTYTENPEAPPGSRRSDTTLLVNGTDYYHLECQMRNDQDMVIRMIAYDMHFAMQYSTFPDSQQGGFVMHFPRSTVIYPEQNKNLPAFLRCKIIFPDESEHIYQIPTIRIQSYSLQEIREKHLMIFMPYILLRLRPKLNPKRKHPLSKKELTDLVNEAILILQAEFEQGYLTPLEFNDYIHLFRFAAEKIFENKKYPNFNKEVDNMTSLYDQMPSVREKRLRAQLLAEKNSELAEKNNELAEKDSKLAEKDAIIAQMSAELAQIKALLNKHNIVLTP